MIFLSWQSFRFTSIFILIKVCKEFVDIADYHSWLLSDEVDILSRLLLPLAGNEEFDEDDMEKLPVDLQYLPPEKEREQDPDLRLALIEAITQVVTVL